MAKKREGWQERKGKKKLTMVIFDPTGKGAYRREPKEVAVRLQYYGGMQPPKREAYRKYSEREEDRKRLRGAIDKLMEDEKYEKFRNSLGVKKIDVSSGWREVEKDGEKVRISYLVFKDEKGNRLTHAQVKRLARKLEEIK